MSPQDRARTIVAAQSILDQGGWCMLEVCGDGPRQAWESRLLIFDLVPDAVADVVSQEVICEPDLDARLTGCNRRTLEPDPTMGAYLCFVAETPPSSVDPASVELVSQTDCAA